MTGSLATPSRGKGKGVMSSPNNYTLLHAQGCSKRWSDFSRSEGGCGRRFAPRVLEETYLSTFAVMNQISLERQNTQHPKRGDYPMCAQIAQKKRGECPKRLPFRQTKHLSTLPPCTQGLTYDVPANGHVSKNPVSGSLSLGPRACLY